MKKNKSIKALICSHCREDREVFVKLFSDSTGIYWKVCDGGEMAGARFSSVDYHNENRAYWIRICKD
jgi:transcription elongation factor Elf1